MPPPRKYTSTHPSIPHAWPSLHPTTLPRRAIALDCQPSFRIWPQEINAGFPDQHSVAHFMVLPAFGPNDLVMIEGTFPAARYFSFQTYDANSAPVAFVRDAQIVPLANKRNPFATPPPTGRAGGGLEQAHYRIYLTKDGKRGFPNELAVAKSNFALGGLTIVVLRLYGVDPRADWSNRELAPWGFVPPVRVSAKIMGYVEKGSRRRVVSHISLTSRRTHPQDVCPHRHRHCLADVPAVPAQQHAGPP